MEPVHMTEEQLCNELYDNYVICENACYPEARHCDTCKVQKRIEEVTHCLDLLQYGMISGTPDSDKPNTAAASNDPLHKKEETMSELTNVPSADPDESAEQPVESTPAEPTQPAAEQPAAEPEQPAASTQPTTYYDRFSGQEVDITKISKKAKRKLLFQSVLWFIVGTGGLVWMIVSIIKLIR